MSVGNESAFPFQPENIDCERGMTYREWLIGMALRGSSASNEDGIETSVQNAIRIANLTIQYLDSIAAAHKIVDEEE